MLSYKTSNKFKPIELYPASFSVTMVWNSKSITRRKLYNPQVWGDTYVEAKKIKTLKKKTKQYYNTFNKIFKNVPHQKKHFLKKETSVAVVFFFFHLPYIKIKLKTFL